MAKRPSMDTITTPDLKNLDQKQSKNINTFDRYSRAEDDTGKIRADFDRATVVHDIGLNKKKEPEKDEGEILAEEFGAKRKPEKAATALSKGVKIKGAYVARKKIILTFVAIICAVLIFALLSPPFFFSLDTESGCRSEDIFADVGLTQYRSELLNNHYVYNMDALSSDQSDSYRICTVAFEAKNYTPFEVEIENYVISDGGEFSDHIVYSQSVDGSDVIPAFSSKTIKVEILINKDGLTDEEFDRAITSIKLHTEGAKKRISKSGGVSCIPGFLNVSDVISFNPD